MRKIFIITLVLLVAAVLAGAGTFAYFSDTQEDVAKTFTSGTFDIALGNNGSFGSGDSVSATWASPPNWAPGDKVNATLSFTNKGTIDADHIYFRFSGKNSNGNGDSSNLMNAILITNLQERFNNVTTGNQAPNLATQVGNHDGVLTLAEFTSAQYYTVDDQSGDSMALGVNDAKDYDLIIEFTFDPNAQNEYQGDTCAFNFVCEATQYSPTEGYLKLHE